MLGNEALFGENAGKQCVDLPQVDLICHFLMNFRVEYVTNSKQCVAMSLTAIIYHQIEHISEWTSSTLKNILTIGNNLCFYKIFCAGK